jgi:hypothetical protein
MDIDKDGVEFIVSEETGGKSYYEKVYKSTFCWPGGKSGPTAMVGIDIGYYTSAEVSVIFKPLTSSDELELIQEGRGKIGLIAKEYTKRLKHIIFSWDDALQTFEHHTMPKFTKLTERVFPGVKSLCPATQTAILSLVFNRGAALKGPSRREMAAIRDLIKEKNYKAIAKQIRSMKRLWDKTSGLVGRREREAKLVESCV